MTARTSPRDAHRRESAEWHEFAIHVSPQARRLFDSGENRWLSPRDGVHVPIRERGRALDHLTAILQGGAAIVGRPTRLPPPGSDREAQLAQLLDLERIAPGSRDRRAKRLAKGLAPETPVGWTYGDGRVFGSPSTEPAACDRLVDTLSGLGLTVDIQVELEGVSCSITRRAAHAAGSADSSVLEHFHRL